MAEEPEVTTGNITSTSTASRTSSTTLVLVVRLLQFLYFCIFMGVLLYHLERREMRQKCLSCVDSAAFKCLRCARCCVSTPLQYQWRGFTVPPAVNDSGEVGVCRLVVWQLWLILLLFRCTPPPCGSPHSDSTQGHQYCCVCFSVLFFGYQTFRTSLQAALPRATAVFCSQEWVFQWKGGRLTTML